MKKIILILTAIFTGFVNLHAQEALEESLNEPLRDLREEFIFGVKVGVNYSNLYNTKDEAFDASPKYGLAAGAFFDVPFGTLIGIHPEILYSEKGFKTSGNGYAFTRTTGFMDIPVFLAIKPSEELTLLVGPQYSYQISQKDRYNNGVTNSYTQDQFSNDNIRKNILSFACGFDFNSNHLVTGARANWDMQDNNGNGTVTNPRYKNVWYQINIGYRIY